MVASGGSGSSRLSSNAPMSGEACKKGLPILFQLVKWILGDGAHIKFWSDAWLLDESLLKHAVRSVGEVCKKRQ